MNTFTIIFLAIAGLVMGSFYACMGYRIPNKISTLFPRSFCPHCKKTLKWYMNIPVFSFIFLKGRCAYCHKPIDYLYPFVETTTALLFVCSYVLFGSSMYFWICLVIISALMVTIVSDFLYYYISDRVLIISGILFIIIELIYMSFNDVFNRLIAAAIIFVIMLLIKWIGNKSFKKESLGDGDIKLMGILAISLGVTNSFVTLFIGSLIGLIFSFIILKRNKEGIIPFGPFLLIGALITIYFMPIIENFISIII